MKKLVIFDFDGVLVRTRDLALTIHRRKNPDLTDDFFDSFSDGNFHDNYQKAVQEGKIVDTNNFYEQFQDGLQHLSTHDVIHLLVSSLAKKYVLIVVSSTTSSVIDTVLKKENIREYFSDILGADIAISKVVKIKEALKKYTVSPTETVFITDTLGDVREGNECGVASIGVTWGSHVREILEIGKPVAIVDTVPELEYAIEEFFSHISS